MQHLPSTPVAARRVVLGAGVAAAGFVVTGSPALAAEGAPVLEILPPETTTWVATGSRSHVRLPAVLGARLRTGSAGLPAGTTARLTWDRRVYEPTVPALTGEDGRPVLLRLVGGPATDRSTGVLTATVRTGAALPAGRAFLLTLGARRPLRYPNDVVAEPVPVTVTVGEAGRAPRRTLAAESAGVTLWGAVAGAGWEPVIWGDGLHTWVPSLVTVRSVGPGPVPAGTAVDVLLDGRVAQEMEARSADGTVSARGRLDDDLLRLRWTLDEPLVAGARQSIRLVVRSVEPRGELAGFQAPTVSVAPPRAAVGQRTTGTESVNRIDNAVDGPSRATYGLDLLTG